MHDASSRPPWAAGLDRIAVALFALAWGVSLLRHGAPLCSAEHWPASLLGALLGYLLADLVSGSVHWLADRYFTPTTPLIGPLLIAPFRAHHRDALEIARHDFFEVSGNTALISLPAAVLLLGVPLPEATGSPLHAGALGLGLGLTAALFLTNQLHRWAHTQRPPAPVRRLQRWGWILSPERHALHHCGCHDRAYCVTSGWLNPLLDRIGFFRGLEAMIEAIRQPRRKAT